MPRSPRPARPAPLPGRPRPPPDASRLLLVLGVPNSPLPGLSAASTSQHPGSSHGAVATAAGRLDAQPLAGAQRTQRLRPDVGAVDGVASGRSRLTAVGA